MIFTTFVKNRLYYMKKASFLALASAISLMSACTSAAILDDLKDSGKETKVEAEAEKEDAPVSQNSVSATTIAGTVIKAENDIAGQVRNQYGLGISGVAVSDGYTVVKTDEHGVYQFKSRSRTRLVYYSTPSGYKISTEIQNPSIPQFYKPIKPSGKLIRTDFIIEPLPTLEKQWTFVAIGDPQCSSASNAKRYTSETIEDIKATLAPYNNVYAATLGDITFDSTDMWPTMRDSMADVRAGGRAIPFFQCIGNHDHDSLKPDTSDDDLDDYIATSSFIASFGPTDYSFNRGDVHIVVMDDIMVTSQKSSTRSNQKTWNFNNGLTDSQISWLRQDLDAVSDKEHKMVFICLHIQVRNGTAKHLQDMLSMLEEFKEAHIMIGHTHYTQNYTYISGGTPYRVGKGGLALYEHIHGSACGAWWTSGCSSTVTGEPSGYTIYEIDGPHIKDWVLKGTRRDKDFQLRVFDGNEVYYSDKTYPLNWYDSSQPMGTLGFNTKGNFYAKGCFVAQVFNDDDTFWKVEMYDKTTGEKVGNFKRLENGSCTNIAMTAYYFNEKGKNSTSYNSTSASHYWYYKPASGTPASAKNWEVRATHTLPGGSASHVYTCSRMSTESTLAKDFYF